MDVDAACKAIENDFPGWRVGSVWATAATGPDHRNLTASKDGILLAAPDAAQLREKIRYEEQQPR